ncbi:glycosyl hydrolase family 20, catalytic domain protein [Teladorsagia circumcincta]|uniref:beta-N-acetylhexosaminidase n=1 Tax=Teladorsagia circumcincta TaxID=45464 RepID=A0A2G9V1A5_TELCI|nr:glycosyl hydrolase family 20, catalytic domain protein [Teladorsagia circumcincta]
MEGVATLRGLQNGTTSGLDVMSQNKMNVLHWHIVDSEAFPYTSVKFPNMSLKGAYTPAHIYSIADIKKIMNYARLRGIRVIPEFDSPEFFEEALTLFGEKFMHFGGDEVEWDMQKCWENNPDVKKRMKAMGVNTTHELLDYYWKTYLDLIKYGADWKTYYQCDPTDFQGTDKQKVQARVLGGEAALWGEYVDGTNFISRMWPRASAVAERLWSDPAQTKSYDDAWPRLHEFRCRMMNRGFAAAPPNAPDYCPFEWDPIYKEL